jgi:hypothetical protein
VSYIRSDSFTGGVNFAGSLDDLERANLHLRARLVDSMWR